MSQAGDIDVIGTHPEIPVEFVANVGAAVPIANVLELLGEVVVAGTNPFRSIASGNTVTYQVQRSQAIASTNALNIGLAAFNSADFSVDANGFVSLVGPGLGVLSVSGTLNRITSTGGQNPIIDIAATYVGQTSITTLGTITTGVWNGTVVGILYGGTSASSFNINGAVYSNTTTTGSLQSATLTSGQLLIGGTTTPAAANLTAGAGVTITNGNNSITISNSTGGFAWSDTSGTVTASVQNGYFITTTCTSTLPASPNEGDTVKYIVDTTNLLTITANTGQKIRVGTQLSATAGTCVNTQRGDAIVLVYRTTGLTWFAENNPTGGWNIT